MEFRTGEAPVTEWTFPAPIGTQAVVAEFTMADSATIPTHLKTREMRTYMSVAAVNDLRAPDLSPPVATDEQGRSAQAFSSRRSNVRQARRVVRWHAARTSTRSPHSS
jgi:hypothetical protein